MKIERTRNATRNIFWGVLNKVISIVLPFIGRTMLIYILGAQFVGLNSLFTSVLSVLNLAELGFGSAMIFSLYKPVAEDDTEMICKLMMFYKKTYRIIGIVIMACGITLLPFIKVLISGEIPDGVNIYIIYIINLMGTVVSYFLFAYKNCLFLVNQRTDISSKVASGISIIQCLLQIGLLIAFENYYLYIILIPIANAANNIIVALIATKKYPMYFPKGELDKVSKEKITNRVKALFFYKVGGVVNNTVDNIVISAFLGLELTGIYGNYYYIISSLFGFLTILYNSISAGIGNSIVIKSSQDNLQEFYKLNFMQNWLVTFCTACLVSLYQPFMKIWVGENLLLPTPLVYLLGLYFYVWKKMDIVYTYKDAAGMWEVDKYRPLISAVFNLVLNLLTVQKFGLYGVIFSTVISQLLFSYFWCPIILYKNYFKVSVKPYFLLELQNFAINLIIISFTYLICETVNGNGYMSFIIKIVICLWLPNICLVVYNKNNNNFYYWNRKIISIIKSYKNKSERN